MLRAMLMLMRTVVASVLIAASSTFLAMAAELVFDLEIRHGRVSEDKRLIRVEEGDVVKLRWKTDQAVVLHLHGYDIENRSPPAPLQSSHSRPTRRADFRSMSMRKESARKVPRNRKRR